MSVSAAGEMKRKFFCRRKPSALIKDLLGGIIVALVSVPISMGYAQIAGLPMQYGLYGSVLPIFLFGIITSSNDFVFGVDAAPAALAGTTVAALGITYGSDQAVSAVPMISFFTACWLMLFFLIKAGRAVQYISEPVMGGFISGICCTIILMQVPKLFGGSAGVGEAPELIKHIADQAGMFNPYSFSIGIGVIVIITVFRYILPKVPMSIIMMAAGIIINLIFSVGDLGVAILPEVERGFPWLKLPELNFSYDSVIEMIFDSLSIAAVILSESLLASKGYASKDGYKLNPDREIAAYSAANLVSALTGCCPVNGSVSRTGIVRQFGVKSQWMSVSAAVSMLLLLYFCTPLIGLMPVPVLTAIVISALMGACEFRIAAKLFKTSKQEFFIFTAAFLGVLVFGTVYGVLIGVGLSFVAVIIRAAAPPRAFLGVIRGKEGFYSLERNRDARAIKNTVIYRFGGNLFFANTEVFMSDIEKAVDADTKQVIISAGAVGSIDIAAAEALVVLYKKLKEKNIKFYITEHAGEVNDMLRKFGAEELIREGAVRMTVALALRDAGVKKPYETADEKTVRNKKPKERKRSVYSLRTRDDIQAELEWAFGSGADDYKNELTDNVFEIIINENSLSPEMIEKIEGMSRWGRLSLFDEEELLDRLETKLLDRAESNPQESERIESVLEDRRRIIERKLNELNPAAFERVKHKRLLYAQELYERDPENFEKLKKRRISHLELLKKNDPQLAEKYYEVYRDFIDR